MQLTVDNGERMAVSTLFDKDEERFGGTLFASGPPRWNVNVDPLKVIEYINVNGKK